MALYHKLNVKNGFAFVLQFFLLISDCVGGVNVIKIYMPGLILYEGRGIEPEGTVSSGLRW